MGGQRDRKQRRQRIRRRYRSKVRGSAEQPRLAVYKSLRYLYAQVIDDEHGVTLAAASTFDKNAAGGAPNGSNRDAGKKLGAVIAERAKTAGVSTVVFDRGGFTYHGVIRAIAEGAREGGLKF